MADAEKHPNTTTVPKNAVTSAEGLTSRAKAHNGPILRPVKNPKPAKMETLFLTS